MPILLDIIGDMAEELLDISKDNLINNSELIISKYFDDYLLLITNKTEKYLT